MSIVRARDERLFKFELPATSRLGQTLSMRAAAPLERLLAMDRLNDLYDFASARAQSLDQFLDHLLGRIGARCHVHADDLARIPATGPVIVVANHPFGALEGLLLASMLGRVRPDFRILANFLLQRIPELRDIFLFVDPFGGSGAASSNIAPLRQAIRWVKDGGLLATFPAGEVSHLHLRERQIFDPPWNPTVARIARMTGAPVVPIFFEGSNTPLFQLLGLVHPRVRTAMLIREVFTKRGQRVDVRVGSIIPPRKLQSFESDAEMTDFLRQRTYWLKHRPAAKKIVSPVSQQTMEPIDPPGDASVMRAEVAALPVAQTLVDTPEFRVCYATAPQIPHLLREIGRLRELTFRATGEGTGKSTDIDTFDFDYLHLFVWSKSDGEVIGGYRIGQTDVILRAKGHQGLYTSTLFDYKPEVLRRINPALELGRSFVAPAHQKAYAPLMLLWKGIGQLMVREPRYRHLYGPVSISNTYSSVSKQLMVRFLRLHHGSAETDRIVKPKHPFPDRRVDGFDDAAVRALLHDGDDLSEIVSEIEPDQKGIPVLLRQYLKFGAKLLAINVDPQFSDVVDGLLYADLSRAPRRMMEKYMGRDGAASFLAYRG